MGCAKGRLNRDAIGFPTDPRRVANAEGLESRGLFEGREEARKPSGEQRLPRARGARQEEPMAPCRRDFERPLCEGLTPDVRQTRHPRKLVLRTVIFGLDDRKRRFVSKVTEHLGEIVGGDDPNAGCLRRLPRAGPGHDDLANADVAHGECRGEGASCRAQSTVEGEFADEPAVRELFISDCIANGAENRDRDGKVEPRPLFAQFSGGKIDRDPSIRKGESRRRNRTADPRGTLSNRRLGKSYDIDPGQLGRQPHLDLDRNARDPR